MNSNGHSIEMIRFKVDPAKAEKFIEARATVDSEVSHIDGFLGSELCRLDEETWIIFVRWNNQEKTKAAQKITEHMPSISSWIGIADAFISFETCEVKYATGTK